MIIIKWIFIAILALVLGVVIGTIVKFITVLYLDKAHSIGELRKHLVKTIGVERITITNQTIGRLEFILGGDMEFYVLKNVKTNDPDSFSLHGRSRQNGGAWSVLYQYDSSVGPKTARNDMILILLNYIRTKMEK